MVVIEGKDSNGKTWRFRHPSGRDSLEWTSEDGRQFVAAVIERVFRQKRGVEVEYFSEARYVEGEGTIITVAANDLSIVLGPFNRLS